MSIVELKENLRLLAEEEEEERAFQAALKELRESMKKEKA